VAIAALAARGPRTIGLLWTRSPASSGIRLPTLAHGNSAVSIRRTSIVATTTSSRRYCAGIACDTPRRSRRRWRSDGLRRAIIVRCYYFYSKGGRRWRCWVFRDQGLHQFAGRSGGRSGPRFLRASEARTDPEQSTQIRSFSKDAARAPPVSRGKEGSASTRRRNWATCSMEAEELEFIAPNLPSAATKRSFTRLRRPVNGDPSLRRRRGQVERLGSFRVSEAISPRSASEVRRHALNHGVPIPPLWLPKESA